MAKMKAELGGGQAPAELASGADAPASDAAPAGGEQEGQA